ncbi:MAG TPA: hypothetical protein VMI75_31130 [Polyangiaceae bacterium]|nr:hypothetical protein [Polyangiaceae bacterium]
MKTPIALTVLLAGACSPSGSMPSAVDISTYEADQVNCIDEADARAPADACRAAVKAAFCAKYPGACLDGGAP